MSITRNAYNALRKVAAEKGGSAYDEVSENQASLKESLPSAIYNTLGAGALGGLAGFRDPFAGVGLGAASGLAGSLIAGVNSGTPGDIAARLIKLPIKKESLKKGNPLTALPFIGNQIVGPYRDAMRDMHVDRKLSGGKNVQKSRVAELYGGVGNAVIAAVLGGLLSGAGLWAHGKLTGQRLTSHDISEFAGYSALASAGLSGLSSVVGRAIGLLKEKKTDKEHADYLKNSVLAHWLVPGVAGYHAGRRARMKGNIFA